MLRQTAVLAVSVLSQAACAQGLDVWAAHSSAWVMNSDGTSVLGAAPGVCVWNRDRGFVQYDEMVGSFAMYTLTGISEDGTRITGSAIDTNDPNPILRQRAFQSSGFGTMRLLPSLGGAFASEARGVSGDGEIVVGMSGNRSFSVGEACIWVGGGPARGLGRLRPATDLASRCSAISRDGTTVVGTSRGFDLGSAFRWTAAEGMTALADPAGTAFGGSALCVNGSGDLIGGDTGDSRACLWRDGVGEIIGGAGTSVTSVSDRGEVILGMGWEFNRPDAVIFRLNGTELLIDYLRGLGNTFEPTTRISSASVSGDGRTICGRLIDPLGESHGFVATIPSAPGSAVLLFGVVARRPSRPRSACPRGVAARC